MQLEKDAIEHIQKSNREMVEEARNSVLAATTAQTNPFVALPDNIKIHELDLEKHNPNRLRFRGTMITRSISEFGAYCLAANPAHARNFVSPSKMESTCYLNFGTRQEPGHCDDTALLTLNATPEYSELTQITDGPKPQKDIAEWLEDWADYIECLDQDGTKIELRQAVNAVRKITIEGANKVESETQSFSETKSAFESIEANRDKKLPAWILFTCSPYSEIKARTFEARLSIITGNEIRLRMRIRQLDSHEQAIREELAAMLSEGFGEKIATTIGAFRA